MRESLIQYVELLFAGAAGAEEIKQEILQNTLDRYDDLISQGKSPESAYRLAISGIGDVRELLDAINTDAPAPVTREDSPVQVRKLRAAAIAMYIASAIPLFILSELGYSTLGLCMTILLVAAATYLMVLSRKSVPKETAAKHREPRKELIDRIGTIVSVTLFLLISILTGAWHITWLIFPIIACVEGLINAILDLREAIVHEN